MVCVYREWNIIQKYKKNKILPFVTTWMDPGGIMLREISQAEKGKHHMISFICGILKKKEEKKPAHR